MSLIGLSSLVAPHSVDDFLLENWPNEPFAVHGLGPGIEALRELSFLQSLDSLLNSWPRSIQAHLPDLRDEASAIDVNPADARKLFANRMGLLFNNAHLISPVLTQWLAALAKDLGLPLSTHGRCMIYATPDGKGTAAHFDQNVNFVLQLQGTKTWWLARNTAVQYPTQRHTEGQTVDPELRPYVEADLRMPAERVEITLDPGSMLFVPRGYWHMTEARGEALALNFTFSQPTWIDIFTTALRSRLMLSPEWRELADGVNAVDEDRRQMASQKLEILLMELVEDIPHWQASDILAATEGPR